MSQVGGGERGSGSVLVLAVTVVALPLLLGAVVLAELVAVRAQLQTAADAAALAAAVATFAGIDPMVRATELASANGAHLLHCACRVDPLPVTRTAFVVVARPVEVPLLGELEVRAAAEAEYVPADPLFLP